MSIGLNTALESLVHHSAEEGNLRETMASWLLSVERCVVLRAISSCCLDAVKAKTGQNNSLLSTQVKDIEKRPHVLAICLSHSNLFLCPGSIRVWCGESAVPTTSAGLLGNNRGVKMSDRHLTTHTATTYKWKKIICGTHKHEYWHTYLHSFSISLTQHPCNQTGWRCP